MLFLFPPVLHGRFSKDVGHNHTSEIISRDSSVADTARFRLISQRSRFDANAQRDTVGLFARRSLRIYQKHTKERSLATCPIVLSTFVLSSLITTPETLKLHENPIEADNKRSRNGMSRAVNINRSIIRAFEAGSAKELAEVVSSHSNELSGINIRTAAHRIERLVYTKKCTSAFAIQNVFPILSTRMLELGDEVDAQSLVQLARASLSVGYTDTRFINAIIDQALTHRAVSASHRS